MMDETQLSWNEFKELVNDEQGADWMYRGHASMDWELRTILGRFLEAWRRPTARNNCDENTIFSGHTYHSIIKEFLCDNPEYLQNHPEIRTSYPEEYPLKIGITVGANDNHKEKVNGFFEMIVYLRHHGFPSPILDWTKNPLIATFFAACSLADKPLAIIRMKKSEVVFGVNLKGEPDAFGLNLQILPLDSQVDRHKNQQSVYTLLIHQYHADTCQEERLRQGPSFYLAEHGQLSFPKPTVNESIIHTLEPKKFVITDSEIPENRLKILKELYDRDISYSTVYGKTDFLENPVLKDLAFKLLDSTEPDTTNQAYPLSAAQMINI